MSTNGTSTWFQVDSVSAYVSGGNYPEPQYDSQTLSGTITVSVNTNVSDVSVRGSIDYDIGRNGKNGYITVKIESVSVDIGVVNIICNNTYNVGGGGNPEFLSCDI